eukprot:scaffold114468_cov36-Phaeocystis_antarctica.AAC.1
MKWTAAGSSSACGVGRLWMYRARSVSHSCSRSRTAARAWEEGLGNVCLHEHEDPAARGSDAEQLHYVCVLQPAQDAHLVRVWVRARLVQDTDLVRVRARVRARVRVSGGCRPPGRVSAATTTTTTTTSSTTTVHLLCEHLHCLGCEARAVECLERHRAAAATLSGRVGGRGVARRAEHLGESHLGEGALPDALAQLQPTDARARPQLGFGLCGARGGGGGGAGGAARWAGACGGHTQATAQ